MSYSLLDRSCLYSLKVALYTPPRHRGIAQLVLMLDIDMVAKGQPHVLETLPPGKALRYAFNRKLGGPGGGLDVLEER